MFDIIIISLLAISIVLNIVLYRKLNKISKSNANKIIEIMTNKDTEKNRLWGEFHN